MTMTQEHPSIEITADRNYLITGPEGQEMISKSQLIGEASQSLDAVDSELTVAVLMDTDDRTMLGIAGTMSKDAHVLFDSDPGTGKTTIAKALAQIIGGKMTRFQGGPDLTTGDITGRLSFNRATRENDFKKGPIFGNVVLADELPRAGIKQQAALIEPMAEGQVTIDDITYDLPQSHIVIGTRNPENELEGNGTFTSGLIDRFGISFSLPKFSAEDMVTAANLGLAGVRANRAVTPVEQAVFRAAVNAVAVPDKVKARAANIIVAMREHGAVDQDTTLLAGARPLMQIVRFAAAVAIKNNRSVVYDNEVDFVAPYILNHRVVRDWKTEAPFEEIYQDVLKKNPRTSIKDTSESN